MSNKKEYGTTWWGQEWLKALTGIDLSNRISRGKVYANTGKVYNISIVENSCLIKARVKGNYDPFYSVKIGLPPIDEDKKNALIDKISESPLILARLSARELDPSVLEIAESVGIKVFPTKWSDLQMKCSCPDYAIPCKHLSAVIYKISEEIDANPFILFTIRCVDIIKELEKRNIHLNQVSSVEMISYKDILTEDLVDPIYEEIDNYNPNDYDEKNACFSQQYNTQKKIPNYSFSIKSNQNDSQSDDESFFEKKSLSKLCYTEIPNIKDSIISLFKETPAGYIHGSLRDVMSKVMDKAAEIAKKQLKNKDDRDLPKYKKNEPIVTFDSLGNLNFYKKLSWTVYPAKNGGKALIIEMPKPKRKSQITEPSNLLYDLFSGFFTEKFFEDQPEGIEALYHLWVISTKLVISGAIIPQIYSPIEGLVSIRWIPAVVKKDIEELVLLVGECLKEIPRHYLKIERAPLNLSPSSLAKFYFSAFIGSYIEQGYLVHLNGKQEDSVECMALFRNKVIDVDDYTYGESMAMRLDAWIAPLYMESKVKSVPVIWLRDNLEKDGEDNTVLSNNLSFSLTQVHNEPTVDLSFGFNQLDPEDHNRFVNINEILSNKNYKNVRFECMRMVSRLANYCPSLYSLLKKSNNDSLSTNLTMLELTELMQKSLPCLELLGVKFVIPKSLQKIWYPKTKLSINLSSPNIEPSVCFTSLKDILSFDWKLAIGDCQITESDFNHLCKKVGQLVRFNDSFVYIDPKEISKIQKQLEKQKKLDDSTLLRAMLTKSYEDDDVEISSELKIVLNNLFNVRDVDVPKSINATLRPYQERGYSWLYCNYKASIGTILADDMGLGKTLQTITLLVKLKEEKIFEHKKGLIVVPTSLMSNWAHELNRFAPNIKYDFVYGLNQDIKADTDIVITTYGNLRSKVKLLSKNSYSILIIDEAQAIKNRNTSTFKAVKSIKADGKIALSGTPVENRLLEYWSIMDFVNPGLLGSADRFSNEYAKPIESEHNATSLDKFKKLTSPFIMRRLKSDKSIISDLPEKIISNQYIELCPEQIALYKQVVDKYLKVLEDDDLSGLKRSAMVLNLMLKLKQICNSPYQYLKEEESYINPDFSGKGQRLLELLNELVDQNKKVLIFTQFKEMGYILQNWIKKSLGKEPFFLHGGVNIKDRGEMVESFQTDRSQKIMILSLKAAGTGLNLTAATAVIHYDLWWNPAVESQATDRAYRIGQKNNVSVYRFISENTFEEKINDMIERKKELVELTVNIGENWIGDLSNRQLKDIFSLS